MSEEDRWTEIFAAHAVAQRITAESVSKALDGYSLQPVRDLNWLARAIQPAVYCAAGQVLRTRGPADVRDELLTLAKRARTLCLDLFDMSNDAQEALWQFAKSLPDASDATANAQMKACKDSWEQFAGLMVFLEKAAAHAVDQAAASAKKGGASKQWERAEDKEWRKWFAVWLSPAFEDGFDRHATLTNPSRNIPHRHGHWADFCERIMRLAFPERKGPLAREVMQSAGAILRQVRGLAQQRGESSATVLRFPPGWHPKDRHSS